MRRQGRKSKSRKKFHPARSDAVPFTITKTEFSEYSSFGPPNAWILAEDLKRSHFEHLYCLLVGVSAEKSFLDSSIENVANNSAGLKLKPRDIVTLSHVLFDELPKKFDDIISMVVSERHDLDISTPLDDLTSLLRCCLVTLPLLEFDPRLLSKRCQVLVAVLEKSCNPDALLNISHSNRNDTKFVNCCQNLGFGRCFGDSVVQPLELDKSFSSVEQISSKVHVLCSILEVFADELLKEKQLTKYFLKKECISEAKKKGFTTVHYWVIVEVVSAHFLLSVSNGLGLHKFSHALCWSRMDFKLPTLTLNAALTLLSSSVILTAPYLVLAHMVSLVSRCIGMGWRPVEIGSSPVVLISAFELAVKLYTRQVCPLLEDCLPNEKCNISNFSDAEPNLAASESRLNFDRCVISATYDKIKCEIAKVGDSCHPCSCRGLQTSPHIMSISTSYIQENKHILDDLCKDKICSILEHIIEKSVLMESQVNTACAKEINWQEMCLLNAVLKLMSCALLQLVRYMKQSGSSGSSKYPSDSECREYNFVIGVIRRFGQSRKVVPHQMIFLKVLNALRVRYEETKLLLVHIAGLLSFAFKSPHNFLWKGCIFMMMTLMSLIFEEVNLDALSPLLASGKVSSSRAVAPKNLNFRRSSRNVSLNFQKAQTLHMERSICLKSETRGDCISSTSLAEIPEKRVIPSQTVPSVEKGDEVGRSLRDDRICNGEPFIKCQSQRNEFDDLADFIACTEGKDYCSWLKNKERFRKWKLDRLGVVRFKKMRNACNPMGRRTCTFSR